jgi:hypothetical protein
LNRLDFKNIILKFYRENKLIVWGAVCAIIIIGLGFTLPYRLGNQPSLADGLAIIQVYYTAVGFLAITITLLVTMSQFRKSLAKPKIKVAFNEKGEQQTILEYTDHNPGGLPHPWLINEGNEISRFFQIDVIIPKNIGNYKVKMFLPNHPNTSFDEFGNDYILSCKNEGRYTLFINKPYYDTEILLDKALDINKCIELFKNDFTLKYNIYGDWGEPQGGELKVIIKKQEVTNVPTSS